MSPKSRRRDPRRPSDRRRARRRANRRTAGPRGVGPGTAASLGTAGSSAPTASNAAEVFAADVLRAAPELADTTPLQLETFCSSVVGTWWRHPAAAEVYGPALLAHAERQATPQAFALLRGLAAMAELPFAARAADAAARLARRTEPPLPGWLDVVGGATVRDCVAVEDEYGDTTRLVLACGYAEEPAHGLVVHVDHNLGGLAQHIQLADDVAAVLDQLRTTDSNGAAPRTHQLDLATVKELLGHGLSVAEQVADPPVTAEYRHLRAMLAARVRALPDDISASAPTGWTDEARRALVKDFLSSAEAAHPLDASSIPGDAVEAIAIDLVTYGCENDRGRPLRVSPTKLKVFLLGWLPLTGVLDRAHVPYLGEVLSAWVRYAARRDGLPERLLAETLEALDGVVPEFAHAYEDPERWGPARRAVEAMLADVDPDTDDADEVFARRMLGLPEVPAPGFDATAEASFVPLVAKERPEYAAAVSGTANGTTLDGVPVERHLAARATVARQLWFDDPREVWAAAQRLHAAGYERAEILRTLTCVRHLAEHTSAGSDGYRAALDLLAPATESDEPPAE